MTGVLLALLIAAAVEDAGTALRTANFPTKPEQGRHVSDHAGLLSSEDRAAIERIADDLEQADGVAVYVATVLGLEARNAPATTVDRYADGLFEHWGLEEQAGGRTMLLLVAVGDRQARLLMGPGWGGRLDDQARLVVDRLVAPMFARGDPGRGLREAARGMEAMARGKKVPAPAYAWGVAFIVFLGLSMLVGLGAWTFREGLDGLGGYLLGAALTLAGALEGNALFMTLGLALAMPVCLETLRWRRRVARQSLGEDEPRVRPYWSRFLFPAPEETGGLPAPLAAPPPDPERGGFASGAW